MFVKKEGGLRVRGFKFELYGNRRLGSKVVETQGTVLFNITQYYINELLQGRPRGFTEEQSALILALYAYNTLAKRNIALYNQIITNWAQTNGNSEEIRILLQEYGVTPQGTTEITEFPYIIDYYFWYMKSGTVNLVDDRKENDKANGYIYVINRFNEYYQSTFNAPMPHTLLMDMLPNDTYFHNAIKWLQTNNKMLVNAEGTTCTFLNRVPADM